MASRSGYGRVYSALHCLAVVDKSLADRLEMSAIELAVIPGEQFFHTPELKRAFADIKKDLTAKGCYRDSISALGQDGRRDLAEKIEELAFQVDRSVSF